MAKKETKYSCRSCDTVLLYEDLIKELTHTVNKKIEHYTHKCPNCMGRLFSIFSTVERL